jgi:hypothetical protein
MNNALLIQPPFVQLNAPYPAPYYLKAFLEKQGYSAVVEDHSIGLFEKIFSKHGLERVFSSLKEKEFENKKKEENLRKIARRFFSEKEKWIASIDHITAFLRGNDYEFAYLLTLANGVLPSGPRFDAFLRQNKGNIALRDAPIAASKLLADIADFITELLDPRFSLIRYSASLSGKQFNFFANAEKDMDGYILREFYAPFLENQWKNRENPRFIGITIPFIGCVAGALFCAAYAKARFPETPVIMGGAYVNTELRFLKNPRFFDYADFLCFDKGYGALLWVLSAEGKKSAPPYKTFFRENNAVAGSIEENPASPFAVLENQAVQTVFPDYHGLDFSRYLRVADDPNPMRSLWTDGRWLKAYTAYGCYWRSCAFCDTCLDYIKHFLPVDAEALFASLADQAEKTGAKGVHLVDEAAPPQSLMVLAELNRSRGLPLRFWGNIRFEKAFTPDAAALLSAGGLIGVSGGVEIATESGFKRLGKGGELRDAAGACAAFKEQGILAHAYLIYGYYDEDDQEIADSAEITRQFFQNGLIDSAFWHQFILTRHSRVYAEAYKGVRKGLGEKAILAPPFDFALNDLSFDRGGRFDKWAEPLDFLLEKWMAGDFFSKLPFNRRPSPQTGGLVAGFLDAYARARDETRSRPPETGRAVFLGSRPLVEDAGIFWRYRLADFFLKTDQGAAVKALLEEAAKPFGVSAPMFYARFTRFFSDDSLWYALRNKGLVIVEMR